MTEREPMQMCPMSEMCKGFMSKPFSGLPLIIPGLIFIAVGVLIIFEPQVLVWLVAVLAIIMGLMMLGMAAFLRSMNNRIIRG